MLVAEKKITVEEFRHMDLGGDDAYYELINGEIVMKAAPSPFASRGFQQPLIFTYGICS